MNRTNKKGFTIVELVIVIAIIAILAAILIPTFSSIIQYANRSAALQLVRNLNTALVTDSATSGKHTTMQSALDAAEKFGYDVGKINASGTDNEILWDSKNDVFCYFEKGTNGAGDVITYVPEYPGKEPATGVDYFVIKNTISDKYSTYLFGYTGDSDITITKGLDVGTANIKSITYDRHEVTDPANGQTVIIRTNSANTALDINAPVDTVKHYGAVGSLNIEAVANASYHEFGKVAFAEIATGRIVLESESEVEHIHLTATGTGSAAYFNDITVAKAENVEMPEFSRDPVEIPTEGKLVVALQEGTKENDKKEYVWLTAVGIYEQVTVSETSGNAGTTYATSDSVNAEKKETAQQIANNITFTSGNVDYKVTAKTTDNGATWTYEVVDNSGNVSEDYSAAKDTTENTVNVQTTGDNPETVETAKENGLTEAAKEEAKAEIVNKAIENTVFAGVAVTKTGEPTQFMTLEAFRDSVNEGNSYAGYVVKLLDNIDLNDIEWTPIGNSSNAFSGVFDGQGYKISNLKVTSASGYAGLFGNVTGTAADAPHTSDGVWDSTSNTVILNSYSEDKYTAVVKNLVIEGFAITNTSDNYVGTVVAYGKDAYFANLTVKNGTVNGNGKTGGVIGATGENVVLDYLSTESSVTVSSTGHSVGGIIGGVNRGGSTPHLAVIANCTNRAYVFGTDTSNGIAAGILGHGGSTSGLNVAVINCANYGEVKCQTRTAGIVANAQKAKLILNCVNYGKVWNEATSGNNILGGIAGECDTNGLKIIACINNGQVTGYANNGKIAGIIGSIQNANLIEGCVNRGVITNTKDNGVTHEITSGAANVLVANEATYTVDSSVSGEMTKITITGEATTCTSIVIDNEAIEKVFVAIDNFNGTITGLEEKTLYISGANSTVIIPQNSSIDKVIVSGANCTIINNGTVGTIRFEVAGNNSIENNGTISNSANNEFTISSTVNGANVSIANNGTIAASGSEGAYALYFSSGATCTVNNHGTITGNNFGKVTVSE